MKRLPFAGLWLAILTIAAQAQGALYPPNYFLAGPGSGTTDAFAYPRAMVAADLPLPTSGTLGGVKSLVCLSHQWLNSIGTNGSPACAQPAYGDISGLGTMAEQAAGAVAITGGTITGMGSPIVSSDVATKGYVDNAASGGVFVHAPVAWATAAVLPNTPTYSNGSSGVGATLTAGANAAIAVDGGNPGSGDRVLVQNQATGYQNGVYTVTTVGSGSAAWVLTRATDFNTAAAGNVATGAYFFVAGTGGTVNTSRSFTLSVAGAITIGATALTFQEFSGNSVVSVSNSDGTLTISPTIAAVIASINLAHKNTWTAPQIYTGDRIDTPEAHGAPVNGSSDDAAAIRAAMVALNALSGGTLKLSCNQTYIINSAGSNDALFNLYPSVNIDGCGHTSILKVTYGSPFYWVSAPVSFSTAVSNVRYSNFKIDVNSDLNEVQTGGAGAAIAIQKGSYITVDNIDVWNNPGSNDLIIGSCTNGIGGNPCTDPYPTVTDAKIVNSTFQNSCDSVAGSHCTDHSSIYLFAYNGVVANNNFISGGNKSGEAIETHGSAISVIGNNVVNYFGCLVPAANDGINTGLAYAQSFIGNNCYGVAKGVNMFTDSSGYFIQLTITGNNFYQNALATVPIIDMSNNVFSSNNYGINVAGNTINGNTNNTTGIALGPMYNAMITTNMISNVQTGINRIGNSVGSSLIAGNLLTGIGSVSITGSGTNWITGCTGTPTGSYQGFGTC